MSFHFLVVTHFVFKVYQMQLMTHKQKLIFHFLSLLTLTTTTTTTSPGIQIYAFSYSRTSITQFYVNFKHFNSNIHNSQIVLHLNVQAVANDPCLICFFYYTRFLSMLNITMRTNKTIQHVVNIIHPNVSLFIFVSFEKEKGIRNKAANRIKYEKSIFSTQFCNS